MLKSFELKCQLFEETDPKFKQLEQEKKNLTKKEYKQKKKELIKYTNTKLKEINKLHPFKKEVQKIINGENND